MSMITEDLIPRETARRIINSPRNVQQMLMMLDDIPSADPVSNSDKLKAYQKAFKEIREYLQYEIEFCSGKYTIAAFESALNIVDKHNPDKAEGEVDT